MTTLTSASPVHRTAPSPSRKMAPAPCLPTGQAEALPPMPKLKRLSTLRRKIPSKGLNQDRREGCGPRVDTQSSAPGKMAPDLPTDAHGRVPTHTVHHRNHIQPAMRTEVPYMQQRIPPVRSQEPLSTTRYVSPSGYSSNQLTSQHHTSPPVRSQPLTQHQNTDYVSSQWRTPQHSQAPRPQCGHDSRSKHSPNYSQYFGNAGYQTGGNQRHQPRFLQQMHQFSRPGMQHTQQHPAQTFRQNGPGLQSHAQIQVKREENHQQYQSQMQMYQPQNHGQNQVNHMQHYHMQAHQQNRQRQHGPDWQYKGQQQMQIGEKHRQPQTKELPLTPQTRTPQNQNQMNHMLQYHRHNGQKQHGPGLQYTGQQVHMSQTKDHPLNTQTHMQQNQSQVNHMHQYHTQMHRQHGQAQHGPERQQVQIGEKPLQAKEHPMNTHTHTQQNQVNPMHQYHAQVYRQSGQTQHGPDQQYEGQQQVQTGEKPRQSQPQEHLLNTQTHTQPSQDENRINHRQTQDAQCTSQQVIRTMEERALPRETNPQHNHQDGDLSSETPLDAIHRMLQNKKLQHERQKLKENEQTCNASSAGSPKDENTQITPNLPNDYLQSQTTSPPAKNPTQDCPQTNYDNASTPSSVSENLEETPMVEGHTLLSTDTFLTYLKTSAVKEDNGANYTHTPASTPHRSHRVKRKTDASFRFIDLLEEDESTDEDTVPPPRYSASTDQEKEMDYRDEPENNEHPVDKQIDRNSFCDEPEKNVPLSSSSPVDVQVDRNSDVENCANNTLSEEDRETQADVTELDVNIQIEDILKLCEIIPTGVDYDTSFDSVPTTLENHEIETEDGGNLGNLIYPSPFYKQGEDNLIDNAKAEICEETHTSNILHVNSPTPIGCITPPESNPSTPEVQQDEIDKYDEVENNTLLQSSSPVYKQAGRFLPIKNTFEDDTQRGKDEGSESPNDSSDTVTLGIPQWVFSPAEAPPRTGNYRPTDTSDVVNVPSVKDRLTPPDSDPATPENQGKETDKHSDTEDSLSCSSSPIPTLDEDTDFENNSSKNKQTELSKRTSLSPEFSSNNLKLGVSPRSTDATPKSGNFRPASKSKPRVIIHAAPPKSEPKTSKSPKGLKNRHSKPSKPSAPYVPPGYTFPSPCISTPPMSTPLVGSATPVNTYISGGTYIHPTEVPLQVAADMTPVDTGASTLPTEVPPSDANSQFVQATPEHSPAQPTEVSIPPVDANRQLIQESDQFLQAEDTTTVLNRGPANNPSPSQAVPTLPVNTPKLPKLPELKRIRRVRRKEHVPEQPPQKDWINIYRRRMEEMESQGNHSDVGTTVAPKMETNHEEQFLQGNYATASREDGSEAPERHSLEGSYHRKTLQDDSSAMKHFAPSSSDRTKMENGCHKIIPEIDLTIDDEPVKYTPDEDKTSQEIKSSCHPALSAPNGRTYPGTSHREQIAQRNNSTNVQKAPDASAKRERNPSPPKWSSQGSFSSHFRFDPNAKDGSRVKNYCRPQASKVRDVTSNPHVPPTRRQRKPGTSNQRLVKKVSMFMKTDLFLNASDKPKLETKVQCLTCCQTVEGGEAYYHMFFGQLKCEKCDKVIANCQDLIPSLGSVDTCQANSKRPHHYTRWNVSPVDFLCYRLRKQNADDSGSTFLSTLKDMETYLENLSPLRNIRLWKTAYKKCQAFTKLMLASTRQEEDRKKRQKSQNTTEKKKLKKKEHRDEEISQGRRNKNNTGKKQKEMTPSENLEPKRKRAK